SRNDTYDIISTYGNAKNILTVGAVSILSDGYNGPSDVSISSFSSWGPSDDGRIKPEIVAAGVGLTSSIASSDNAYGTQSGTSMSAPNATGSLILLQEYFRKETERFMRSATLKALAIHTANEAGSHPGPDYVHGFGLLNVGKAAEVIKGRTSTHRILEENLEQGKTTSITMVASGSGPLVATICWTDPPAISDFANRLNNPTPKLINDLDIRIKQGATTFSPWRLNRLNPAAPATNGDNTVDNVEKIEINNPIPGETYTIEITHKGNLQNEAQAYSLILSGVGGTAYCTSQPSSNSDSRIDNFTFGGINRNGTGCTQYTNATSVTGAVFPGQSAPFSITLGSCGTNKDKVAKIYADWNNDGDFSDDGELLATSGVISGIGTFNGNIAIPGNLSLGTRTRLRVVVVETNDAGVVSPCGAYTGGGETQDYTLQVNRAEVDGFPLSVVLPVQDACSSNEAYVAVRVQNNGAATLNTLPVTTVVRNGNTVIATLKDTVRIPMTTGRAMTVYHKTPIATTPGVTYTFSVYTDIGNELNRKNDTITVARAIASLSAAVAGNGSGQVCSSGDARVSATITNGTGSIYWYTSSTGGNPIGSGNSFTTSNVPGNRTFYAGVNDASGTIGPPNKAAASLATSSGSPSGGYNTFSPAVKINVVTPLIIESARMYFGNHGRIVVSVVNESSGITVSQTTLDITATAAFATNEAQNNDLQDTGRIMPLNLLVPAAGNYLITVAYENGATVFRNNNISATPYPLNLPGLMSITGNTATTTSEAFYYYFYAMKVRAAGCVSSQPRLAVVANAPLTPTITQNGNTLRSSVTNGSFTWLLNGTVVPNATGNTLTISEGGNYRVQVNTGGCVFESPEFPAVLTAISNVDPAEIGLTLTPNPAKEKAEIRFSVKKPAQIALELVDMSGKRVHAEQFAALPGSVINRTLSLEELPSGLYLVRVYFDNKQFVRRLMIAK
ncbi:MAG: S8 family serine peptidase, partial [Chitinophagaceae bacterium]